MGLDRPPQWWRKPHARRETACYERKAEALHAFLGVNARAVDRAGGLDQVATDGTFDAVNEKYGLKGERKVRTLGEAFWVAMPSGRPFCVEKIDLDTLNDLAGAARDAGFRLPDNVVEDQMRKREADYYNAATLDATHSVAIDAPDGDVSGVRGGSSMLLWITGGVAALAVYFLARGKPGGAPAVGAVGSAALRKLVEPHAKAQSIPVEVVLAWITLESGGNPNAYNPEASALKKWASAIAGDVATWGANPDFAKAGIVQRMLTNGTPPAEIAAASKASMPFKDRLWTFGSSGLMQVSRITAVAAGYPADKPNAGLFDPETNVRVGTNVIASLRKSIYPGKTDLSVFQWSIVRAGYVLGAGGVKSRLAQATEASLAPVREKQTRFYAALGKLTGVKVDAGLAGASHTGIVGGA